MRRTEGLVVCVCGGRGYHDADRLGEVLDRAPIVLLGHGGAPGADTLAAAWAAEHDVPCSIFPADWSQGPRAGPVRNRRMLDAVRPDLLIAFPGGKGTADCITAARQRGVTVMQIGP